jgi:hypothetical protein
MQRKFTLNVPHQEYNVDLYKYIEMIDEQLEIFVNMYLSDIADQDLQNILNKKAYMRFMLFQDEPDSPSYMYAYSRPISDMTEYHKAILDCLDDKEVLGEINYATKGHFFALPRDKVNSKRIKSTDVIGLD